jgi:transposase
MKDIKELVESVKQSTGKWYENQRPEVQEFLNAIADVVKEGQDVNSVKIADILEDEFKVNITPTSVRSWLKELNKK